MKCPKCNHDENYHGIHGCFYHNNCDCNYTRYEVQLNAELTALRSQLATVTAEREAMREALELAKSLIYQHHEIGHIRRAYENRFSNCEACEKNGQLKKLFDAAALKGGKG